MRKDFRSYEPLLLALHRWLDALIGAGLLLAISHFYHVYSQKCLELACFAFFITFVSFQVLDLYRSWRGLSLVHELHQIFWGCFLVYVILFSISSILKDSQNFSSPAVLIWMIAWPLSLGAQRLILRTVQRRYRKRGYNVQRAVIVGAGKHARQLAQWITRTPWCGTKILGFFDNEASSPVEGCPILGKIEALSGYLRDHSDVDRIYIALPLAEVARMKLLLSELSHSTESIFVVSDPEMFDLLFGRTVMYFDGLPVISLRNSPSHGVNALLKRIEDLSLASLFLIMAIPLMVIIGVAIKLTSGGSVLFKQWRYGLDGRPIKVYKFRSMTSYEDGYAAFTQATTCDPRVMKLGAFLRRSSLDELPQLINVLQGRMSIVGPRPHPIFMNEEYRRIIPGYMLRHKVKPGMTGLAQVNGWRGEIDTVKKMEKRVEYDLVYLREWSLLLDLKIIAQTILQEAYRGIH